jgi:hypothetical protein
MTGILPDNIGELPASGPPREPYVHDPDFDKFVLAAIEETSRSRQIEVLRSELSADLTSIPGISDAVQHERGRLLGKGYSPHTQRQYKMLFKKFRDFCVAENIPSLPTIPEAIASFLLEQAGEGVRPTELERALAALRYVHLIYDQSGHRLSHIACNFDDPIIKGTMRWIRQKYDEEDEKTKQKTTKIKKKGPKK